MIALATGKMADVLMGSGSVHLPLAGFGGLTDGSGELGAINATLFLACAKRDAIGIRPVVITTPGGSLTSRESLLRVDTPTGIVDIPIMHQ